MKALNHSETHLKDKRAGETASLEQTELSLSARAVAGMPRASNQDLRPVLEAMVTEEGLPLWVELIPAGELREGQLFIEGRDGRGWINSDPEGIVQSFESNGADLPIDIEHATELKAPQGEPAPAVGWIKALEVREGGAIWGLVSWNNEGRWLVQDKQYRYLSPVIVYDKTSRQILALDSVSLTNKPNLTLAALNHTQPFIKEEMMETILKALGLKENASETEILSAINRLQTEAPPRQAAPATPPREGNSSPSLTDFVPRADYDKALNRATEAEGALTTMKTEQQEKQIEALIEQGLSEGKIAPASVEYHKAACRVEGGLQQFEAFLKNAPGVIADPKTIPPPSEEKALNQAETSIFAMLGIKPDASSGSGIRAGGATEIQKGA